MMRRRNCYRWISNGYCRYSILGKIIYISVDQCGFFFIFDSQ